MARGFLSGILVGGVVASVGLGTVSVMTMHEEDMAQEQAREVADPASVPPVADVVADSEAAQVDPAPVAEPVPEMAEPDLAAPAEVVDPVEDAPVAPAVEVPETTPPVPAAPSETETQTETDTETEAAPEVAPEVTPEADAPDAPESVDTPEAKVLPGEGAEPLGDLAPNVETGRLPSIGDEPEQTAEAANAGVTGSPLAIIRNGVAFQAGGDKPMVAIVLKDEGGARGTLGDLSQLPFPISFIVEATAPDAQEAIDFYRAAGAEVLVQAVLPSQSTPTDVEVNFQVQAPLFEKSVGIVLSNETGVQDNAPLAQQVADILTVSGHGLVTFPKGLNTGAKIATKAGVPSGLVFRDLDGEGQDGRVIRRFIDNAAFKARQEDAVILYGRARAETLQAVVEWSLGNRAKSVALAPVSAVLLR